MEDVKLRALAQLEPQGVDGAAQSWQQRKSVQTRLAILEAAIECLDRDGYTRTTMQSIASRAGVSRGAMLHHYATRQDLIGAVIDYTLYKRVEIFLDGVRELKESARVGEMAAVRTFWNSCLTPEFAAYLELSMASRTDPALAEIFRPKARRYDSAELAEVIKAFPEWVADPEGYALAMDYCNAVFQGMVINRDIMAEADQLTLSDFVGRTIAMLRSHEMVT